MCPFSGPLFSENAELGREPGEEYGRLITMRRLLPLFLTIVLIAAACGDDSSSTDAGADGSGGGDASTTSTTTTTEAPIDTSTPEGQLAAARAQWAENGLTSYTLTTQEICFCPPGLWIDTVVDGVVTDHVFDGDDSFYDPGGRTMEDLFDGIEALLADDYASIELSFHPETGALDQYYIDIDEMIADEEQGVDVISIEPYDGETAGADVEVSAAAFTTDYGCGFGFAKVSDTQDLSLVVFWNDFAPEGPDVATPIELPNAAWSTEVTTGSDLFANWCDDVVEEDDPVPVIASSWSFIAGSLTVSPAAPGGDCPTEVTGTLSGAVIESASGEQITLDTIELRNTGWGCFAG